MLSSLSPRHGIAGGSGGGKKGRERGGVWLKEKVVASRRHKQVVTDILSSPTLRAVLFYRQVCIRESIGEAKTKSGENENKSGDTAASAKRNRGPDHGAMLRY